MKNSGKIFLTLLVIFSMSVVKLQADELDKHIRKKAIELRNSSNLTPLIKEAAAKKLVLLGEASHGTHEYYTWRDSISRRLITEAGFNFILVEGDFASIFELNRYVKGLPGAAPTAEAAMENLDRWPLWMWRNYEVLALVKWLHEHNSRQPENMRVGIYGMDVYDEWRSKEALYSFSQELDAELHQLIAGELKCFFPYWGNSWNYARATQSSMVNCSANTEEIKTAISQFKNNRPELNDYDLFYLEQNAWVVNNAEKFYRKSMAGRNDASWNARATHMFETSLRLLELYGANSKGIVWAHNTHIGDASFTDMARFNQTNIGELSRNYLGEENVMLIGFTTYKGKVQAGVSWGSPRQVMNVRPAQKNSLEERLQRTGLDAFYLLFDEADRNHKNFMQPMGNRAIGVVYNPRQDAMQFVPTIVPMRYDALVFISKTSELNPMAESNR